MTTSEAYYSKSRRSTEVLVEAIKSDDDVFEVVAHTVLFNEVKKELKKNNDILYMSKLSNVICQLDPCVQRAINRAKDGRVSAWLTVLPLVNPYHATDAYMHSQKNHSITPRECIYAPVN